MSWNLVGVALLLLHPNSPRKRSRQLRDLDVAHGLLAEGLDVGPLLTDESAAHFVWDLELLEPAAGGVTGLEKSPEKRRLAESTESALGESKSAARMKHASERPNLS